MGAIFVQNTGGGGVKDYTLARDSRGAYNANTTNIYTMQKDGFVVGAYGGHNSSNKITVYLNGMEVGSSTAGRLISDGITLYMQLQAGDTISVKGSSNSWTGAHFFFFEEA